MAIKIKTDLEFGSVFYIKNDPDQFEHILIAVIVLPGNQFKFRLSYMGEVCEVWDFETSDKRDPNKVLDIKSEE